MADDRLQMIAELRDRASGPMRKIREASATIRETPGMVQARKWMAGFNAEADRFMKGGAGIAGVMGGMGIGGLAAAASIGSLVARFKELADRTLDMRELGREIGLTIDQINAMNHAAAHFGLDPGKMDAALSHFSGLMPEFLRGYGDLNDTLARSPELIRKLRAEAGDTGAQIRDIFKYLDTIKNPQDRMVFEAKILGTTDVEKLFQDGPGGFEKQVDGYAKSLQPYTAEMIAQAQALRDAINGFNTSVDNLELKVGPTVLGALTEGAREVTKMFDDVVMTVESLQNWKDHPVQSLVDAEEAKRQEMNDRNAYRWRRTFSRGDFAAPSSVSDAENRVSTLEAEKAGLAGKDDEKSTIRVEELTSAIDLLREALAKGDPAIRNFDGNALHRNDIWRFNKAVEPVAPKPDSVFTRSAPTPAPLPTLSAKPAPSTPGIGWKVPAAYDREMRARAPDDGTHAFDGWVMGQLDKPVLHLAGTLKTAAAAVDGDGIRPAAFHPATLGGDSSLDPIATIAEGTKQGFLAAMREFAGMQADDASTGKPGFSLASFHPGGGLGGGGGGGGSGGGGNFNFSGTGNGGWEKSGASKAQVAAYIKHAFAAQGIDPNTALSISAHEGLNSYTGDHGTSFGPFQLHYGGSGIRGMNSGGLGDRFTKETGKDARDPTTWRDQVDYAARIARHEGWGAWHGRIPAHIGLRDGIGTYNGPVPSADAYDKSAASASAGPKGTYPDWMDDRSRREMSGINAPLARDLLAASQATGAHFRILQGLRTEAEAAENARKGTGVRNSQHRWGAAADIKLTDAQGRDLDRNSPGYERFAQAFEAHSRAMGGHSRWLGHVPGWSWDRAHFDQGVGYGQSHARNPYGAGGPTKDDIAAGNKEIFSGPDNPFLKASKPLGEAAEKLRGAAVDQRKAVESQSRKPDWYHSSEKPSLIEGARKAGLTGPHSVKVDGGVEAHVHVHDGQVRSARAKTSGHVRGSTVAIRRAPQRTYSV